MISKQHTTVFANRGAALLLFVVLFMVSSLVLVLAIGSSAYHARATYRSLLTSKVGFYAAESGIEDAVYRHNNGFNYDNSEVFSIDGASVSMSRSTAIDRLRLTALADAGGAVRTSYLELLIGEGVAFNFGLQSGTGGILMENNSSIRGNLFSNGTVVGQGSATVYGNVVSAGPTGRIETTHATGSAWAHTITGSDIDKDAYYTTIVGTTVDGTMYPGSPDEDPIELPIDDPTIEGWKDNIENSGTVIASTSPQCAGGTYVIDTDITLGNVKIDCNVEMKKRGAGTTITITDDIWISGDLSFSQGPTIVASSTDISNSIVVIVDKESNRTTSSKIAVNQSTNFTGINASTYLLLISMNNSSENGGSEIAIDLAQSANGKVLVYASHGLVDMGNSISLKEVSAHQIEVSNGAQVVYESGIMSLLFDSGPGGGFTLSGWREIE